MNRYLVLLVVGVAATVAVIVTTQRQREEYAPPANSSEAPVATVWLVLEPGKVKPAQVTVPKNRRLHVNVRNRTGRAATISLAGYQDRMPPTQIPNGSGWDFRFAADRPGEDFAWIVNGEPMGRVRVMGSHLEEGHR